MSGSSNIAQDHSFHKFNGVLGVAVPPQSILCAKMAESNLETTAYASTYQLAGGNGHAWTIQTVKTCKRHWQVPDEGHQGAAKESGAAGASLAGTMVLGDRV